MAGRRPLRARRPGRYALAAFQDLNGDLKLQPFLRGSSLECAAVPLFAHYLFFTMRDGTVTLQSQLTAAAQRSALRIEGYNETHMGVLESPDVAARLSELLDAVR